MARGVQAFTSGSLVVAVILSCLCVSTCAFNITQILTPYPEYSQLNDWLSRTGVATEINNRTTLTVLAPSNTVFGTYLAGVPNAYSNLDKVGDTLRYHVLLGYFGIAELSELPANGTSVTTLLQTTGRANQTQGFVTLYNNGTTYLVGHEFIDSSGNETILGNITQLPYQYSVLQVSAILTPVAPALPSPAPAPSPLSKVPGPAPLGVTPPAVEGPGGAQSTSANDDNHASARCASKLLGLLTMLVTSVVALL